MLRSFHQRQDSYLILDRVVGLDQDEIKRIEELVQAGEFAVAIENVCTQLYEYDVVIGVDTAVGIKDLGTTLGVHDRYWRMLQTNLAG
jgi:hypothetical protein